MSPGAGPAVQPGSLRRGRVQEHVREFEGADELYAWCLSQIVGAYRGIAELLDTDDGGRLELDDSEDGVDSQRARVGVTQGNAGDLRHLADGSQTLVCMDPPYYDNVMYAELADFFYVWEKRTLGLVWPDLFAGELTNKTDEAVTNHARFKAAGRRAKKLADVDYTAKMAAIFSECRRVLRDGGVLTVMFTHKRADAWDGLGTALLRAGFTIETSWPVRTESEQSLHQARKNSAASTIFLVCRKRPDVDAAAGDARTYLDDIAADIRGAAREALQRSSEQGLSGVDLLLSTYGPALSVLSQSWPVHSDKTDDDGRSRLLAPEEALGVARTEVTRLIKARLLSGRETSFDPATDFTVLAWEMFKARKLPFDEARRLALAVGGLDIDDLKRAKIVTTGQGLVTLCEPRARRRRGERSPTQPAPTLLPSAADTVAASAATTAEDSDAIVVSADTTSAASAAAPAAEDSSTADPAGITRPGTSSGTVGSTPSESALDASSHVDLSVVNRDGLSGVDRSEFNFAVLVDALHTALYVVDQDGPGAAKRWLDERGLATDQRFLDCLQAFVRAIPRTKTRGEWNIAEAGLLDRLVAAYFPRIETPPDPQEIVQQKLLSTDR